MVPTDTSFHVSEQVAALRAELGILKDRQAIHEVYVRFGRAVDRVDEELHRSAFWPDAQINYGTAKSQTPAEHWSQHVVDVYATLFLASGHFLTNEAVEVDGDVAHVEIYITSFGVLKEKEPENGVFVSGRYVDRLDRRNGEWRIAVREFLPHFAMKVDTSNYDSFVSDFFGTYSPEQGSGKRDTSYVRPLSRRTLEAGPPPAG